VTAQGPGERTQGQEKRRQERGLRILDAAAALILRWGYNKTTIDDIARQAGVAKGTIYLHWKTREDLFAALIQREKRVLAEEVERRIAGDKAAATLDGLLKHSALALMQRPLLKAVLLRDLEVIGKLVHSEHSSTAYTERVAGFTAYLEVLRAYGLVRSDLSLHAQVYIVSAIFMGFFLIAPLMPDGWTLADEELAELLAETVRRTLEPERAVPPPQAVTDAFRQYLNSSVERARTGAGQQD